MSLPEEPLPAGFDVVFAALLGLLLGSFANVLIHRLPIERSIVWPGSRCPGCDAAIRWYDNLPLVSWVALRGRCRSCGVAISPLYPAVEAAAGLLLAGICLQQGLTLRGAALSWLAISILALVPIDQRYGILPDRITLPGIIAGLAFSIFTTEPGLRSATIGAAAGGGVPLMIRALYGGYARLRHGPAPVDPPGDAPVDADASREGMGLGDVKMLAMVGAFLGPASVVLTIVMGSMIGTLVVAPRLILGRLSHRSPVPFGPFLGVAAVLALFWGDAIIDWYLVRSGM